MTVLKVLVEYNQASRVGEPIRNREHQRRCTSKSIRAKNLGLRIMIDFPLQRYMGRSASSNKPAGWNGQDIATLKTSLANHTTTVLNALKSSGITPEWVQVGQLKPTMECYGPKARPRPYGQFCTIGHAGYDGCESSVSFRESNCACI